MRPMQHGCGQSVVQVGPGWLSKSGLPAGALLHCFKAVSHYKFNDAGGRRAALTCSGRRAGPLLAGAGPSQQCTPADWPTATAGRPGRPASRSQHAAAGPYNRLNNDSGRPRPCCWPGRRLEVHGSDIRFKYIQAVIASRAVSPWEALVGKVTVIIHR